MLGRERHIYVYPGVRVRGHSQSNTPNDWDRSKRILLILLLSMIGWRLSWELVIRQEAIKC